MREYLNLVHRVLDCGEIVPTVQGVGCLKLNDVRMEIPFRDGHPVLTTRSLKGSFRSIVVELLWMLSGSTRLEDLHRHGVHFWDQWDAPETWTRREWQRPLGDLGPIYGHQWRNFSATRLADGSYAKDGFDQISWLVNNLKVNPHDRRNRITTWNPKDAPHQFIAPCHGEVHFSLRHGKLWLHHKQRSCDLLVGGAFDLVTYAILAEMVGQVASYPVGGMWWTIDDCHIYLNQIAKLAGLLDGSEIDQRVTDWANQWPRLVSQLSPVSSPRESELIEWLFHRFPRSLPRIRLNPAINNIFDFKVEDVILEGYKPYPAIKDIPVLL